MYKYNRFCFKWGYIMAKDKLRRVLWGTKYGVFGATVSGLATTIAFSLCGLVAHGVRFVSDEHLSNYSLKNRFETAYCINVPESHKYYFSESAFYSEEPIKKRYMASPYFTYGVIGFAALIGAMSCGRIGVLMAKGYERDLRDIQMARNAKQVSR